MGSTGSGKSTLAKLLLRFYELQTGNITLDDIELQNLNLRDLRRCIGLVSQDVFLFHGTVAENIGYGSFDATESEIITAAKIGEAHEFIINLPQGYETIVGERGQKLSGGQRQRIALARLFLSSAPILILDEATSALDSETEQQVLQNLQKISANRTVFLIAHRFAPLKRADVILVLEKGIIAERGTHSQLLQQKGLYWSLYQRQQANI